jgi:hypothetical protein
VVATDAEGRVFVAWSSAGEIIVRRLEQGEWGSPEKIGLGTSPTLSSDDPVSIGWVRPDGDGFEIAFFDLSEIETVSFTRIFVGATAVAVVLAALILRRRRRA